ncbi:claudin-3-like, partial [Silurus asotus]
MAALGLEILGLVLATIGWIVGIASCALPMWRVTAFIGSNIVTAQIIWQGIWMDCVVQSTGQMQCKVYDSMLALPEDLQAARALCVIAIVLAHTIIMDFYNPVITEAQKRELGASLYLGWAAAALLLTGGAILCCSCPPPQEKRIPYLNVMKHCFLAGKSLPREDSSPLPDLEYKGYLFSKRTTSLTPRHSKAFRWLLAIVSCALPMWRVTAFIGSNIVTAQIYWDGLWMSCVVQSTGQMQCKVYDSTLALSQDLQAARALTVISILLVILAMLVSFAGAKCTNCIDDESSKAKIMIVAGVLFLVAGLMQLIPVSWSANTIIRDFYNPLLNNPQRWELGASLYIGWAATALLILGGSLLCCSCPPSRTTYSASR